MRDSAETGDPDTTKGQFPSEQEGAGGGGGQSTPRVEAKKVSTVVGGTRRKPFDMNNRDGVELGGTRREVKYNYVGILSPVLRINDSILGISHSLSGMYQFSTNYMLYYTQATTEISTSLTPGQSLSASQSVIANSRNPANINVSMSFSPAGTGTISPYEVNITGYITGFTGGYSFDNYMQPHFGMNNGITVTSGQTFRANVSHDWQPAYHLQWFRYFNVIQTWGIIPETSTSFNLNLSVSLDAGATTDANFTGLAGNYQVAGFDTGAIAATLASSL